MGQRRSSYWVIGVSRFDSLKQEDTPVVGHLLFRVYTSCVRKLVSGAPTGEDEIRNKDGCVSQHFTYLPYPS